MTPKMDAFDKQMAKDNRLRAEGRYKPPRDPSKPFGRFSGVFDYVYVAIFIFAISLSAWAFITGRPFIGKSGYGAMTDYNNYGHGAFAADSTTYLAFCGWGIAIAVANIPNALDRVFGTNIKNTVLFLVLGGVIGYVINIASIVLLATYENDGVHYRNFEPNVSNATGYGSSYIIPIILLIIPLLLGALVRSRNNKSTTDIMSSED